MALKKDTALKKIFADFEEFANIALLQLNILDDIISTGEILIPKEIKKKIASNEKKLDNLEVSLSDKIVNTIVLHQPMASDIRRIIACYRIIISLERVGDLVTNIVEFIEKIKNQEVYNNLSEVISNMLIQSTNMVNKALLAFTNDDKEYAIWTIKNDAIIDDINQKLLKKAIKRSSSSNENKLLLNSFMNMNSMVSNIERIADHATNIAEAAIYSIEGRDVRHNKKIE